MAGNRIKGQEVELIIVAGGRPMDTITAVKDFDFAWQLEVKSEGYLGETTERKDMVYKGVKGKMTLHAETADILKLSVAIVNAARNRAAGFKLNIKATLNFPTGRRARIIIRDAQFGEIPVSVGGKAEYVSVSFDYEASEASVIS